MKLRVLITNDYKYKRIMIESIEEFNYLLNRLKEKETLNKLGKSLQIKLQAFKEVETLINGLNNPEANKEAQALQLQQTGVSGCFSYKEALEFLQLHTPIAVKPIKKSKYKFVQPFTSKNARDIVIFSLATELSKNNR